MTKLTLKPNHKRVMFMSAAIGALGLMITPAYAQTTADDVPIQTTTVNPDAPKKDEVIVTGSRIKRDGYDTPSPVQVIDSQMIEESGFANLGEVLQRAPAVAVGKGLTNAQSSDESAGATFLNLRGLGSLRSLTLVNGRRRVPGDFTSSSVDLSAIPTSMVEKVDIVTGGTSAIYGADAVSGVVNVILKKDFEGFTAEGSAGFAEQGGGGNAQQLSLTYGKNFDNDRGNISVGASYYNSEILRANDRDFSAGNNFLEFQTNAIGETFDGVTPTFTVRRNPTTFLYSETGTIYSFNNTSTTDFPGGFWQYFTFDPEIREQTNDVGPHTGFYNQILGNGWATGGDGFNFSKYGLLRGGYQAYNGMINVNYELSENAELYGNFDISSSETESPFQPNFHSANGDDMYVYSDNPLITEATRQFILNRGFYLPSRNANYLYVQRTHDDLGVRSTEVERLNFTGVGGVKGNLSNGWEYDVFGQYGEMQIDTSTSNTMIRQNFLNAIDVVDIGAGPMCRDAAARAAGCLPVRILGSNDDLSQEARDYFLHDKVTNLDLSQLMFGGQVTGDLYELPAGAIGFAAGAEYREEKLHFIDDELNSAGVLLLNSPTAETQGKISVTEAFAEVAVPLLADKPFIKNLTAEGAIRLSDYSQTETTTTWKLGGRWEVSDDLRFRLTRSKSVRAPTITNLFSPGIASFAAVTDPCDTTVINLLQDANLRTRRVANCQALGLPTLFDAPNPTTTKEIITGGNVNLSPENSHSWTVGAIITPSAIDGLKMSVDFWEIDLTDVITSLGFGTILNNCVDFDTLNPDFCDLITRDAATGEIRSILDTLLNIDRTKTNGFDFGMEYSFDPGFVPGSIDVSGNATYLNDYTITNVTSVGDLITDEAGEVIGTPLPEWRANTRVGYSQDNWSVVWSTNFVDSMVLSNANAAGTYQAGYESVDSVWYHYLYADFDINDKFRIYGGINNVFDKAPPANPYTFGGAGGLYDNNGRYFWIGGKARF